MEERLCWLAQEVPELFVRATAAAGALSGHACAALPSWLKPSSSGGMRGAACGQLQGKAKATQLLATTTDLRRSCTPQTAVASAPSAGLLPIACTLGSKPVGPCTPLASFSGPPRPTSRRSQPGCLGLAGWAVPCAEPSRSGRAGVLAGQDRARPGGCSGVSESRRCPSDASHPPLCSQSPPFPPAPVCSHPLPHPQQLQLRGRRGSQHPDQQRHWARWTFCRGACAASAFLTDPEPAELRCLLPQSAAARV